LKLSLASNLQIRIDAHRIENKAKNIADVISFIPKNSWKKETKPAICKIPAIPLAPLNEKEEPVALISLGNESENNPANDEKKPHENCVMQSEISRIYLSLSENCIVISDNANKKAYMEKVRFRPSPSFPSLSEITPNRTYPKIPEIPANAMNTNFSSCVKYPFSTSSFGIKLHTK
jgi:hypothetical protein